MPITFVLVLAGVSGLIGLLQKGRGLVILAVSAFLVFLFQPRLPDPSQTFWLPVLTLALAVLGWALTTPSVLQAWRSNLPALLVLLAVSLFFALNRYFQLESLFEVRTPRILMVSIVWGGVLAACLALGILARWQRPLLWVASVGIIFVLTLTKSDTLTRATLQTLPAFARPLEAQNFQWGWLGFSYISFRLLHTFFEHYNRKLPTVTLAEYVNYIIFFPAFTAGPIDRLERFVRDQRSPLPLDESGWLLAGQRLLIGLFKKYVLADFLAVYSITVLNTAVQSRLWLWGLVYIYAFRIYFDFSGYTDIAIGLARLMGIRLPENFAAPLTRPNLTQFWNAWHMSLTQWFRAYFFNPLLRFMRTAPRPLPGPLLVLISQVTTMILIGLWHGITWNFVLWGLWHGLGLFGHNRWNEFMRPRAAALPATSLRARLVASFGVFLTFNYVALGWVLFVMPTPEQAFDIYKRLFGIF